MNITKLSLFVLITSFTIAAQAQKKAEVQTVITAEENFNKLVAKKGIKEGFLAVADPQGIVFKPDAVNMTEFYSKIAKQPGTLTWTPKFASDGPIPRISTFLVDPVGPVTIKPAMSTLSPP